MLYSEVIDNNWHKILPKKNKYTLRDIKKIKKELPKLTDKQACFVVVCTAAFYDVDRSKTVNTYNSKENQIKRMIS